MRSRSAFLPACPFHQGDHAIQETTPGFAGHFHRDVIAEHARSTDHAAAVTTGFADHRRTLTGDGAFINACKALDDLAVVGDQVARFAVEEVSFAQFIAADHLHTSIHELQFGGRVLPRLPERIGLCLAACLRDAFREIREEQREQEQQEDGDVVAKEPWDASPLKSNQSETMSITAVPTSTVNITGLRIMMRDPISRTTA